jgi:hypothetical protein
VCKPLTVAWWSLPILPKHAWRTSVRRVAGAERRLL